jgi:hypothetical protein
MRQLTLVSDSGITAASVVGAMGTIRLTHCKMCQNGDNGYPLTSRSALHDANSNDRVETRMCKHALPIAILAALFVRFRKEVKRCHMDLAP